MLLFGGIFTVGGCTLLLEGSTEVVPLTLEELVAEGGPRPSVVQVDGQLLQLSSPEGHRFGSDLVFPLVDEATAEEVRRTGKFELPADGSGVLLVRASGDEIPLQAFLQGPDGPPALPRSVGSFRARGEFETRVPGKIESRWPEFQSASGLTLVDHGDLLPSPSESLVMFLSGLLLCWFARWRLRKGRQPALASERAGGPSWTVPLPSASFVGKAAAGLVAIGIAGAKLGAKSTDNVARVADNAARSADAAARVADETAGSAARAGELAGDVVSEAAGFGIGQIGNIKTLLEARTQFGEPRATQRANLRVERLSEHYEAISEVAGEELPPQTYGLVSDESESILRSGSLEESPDSELPDRNSGEYTWIGIAPRSIDSDPSDLCTVRVESGLLAGGGWIVPSSFRCEARFVAGSWDQLESGAPCTLELTEAGLTQYTTGWTELLETGIRAESSRTEGQAFYFPTVSSRGPTSIRLELAGGELHLTSKGTLESSLTLREFRLR